MTDKELLNRGYHRYDPTPFDREGIVDRFQKRYDDEKGKKYFIEVIKWMPMYHPYTGELMNEDPYEYECYLYRKETHDPIRMLFYGGWNLDMVEDHLEQMFNTGMYDYYEEWDYE